MLQKELHKLAETWTMTDLQELEPYVLSNDDEARAIEQAIIAEKKLAAWKMNRMQYSPSEIFAKLNTIDFEAIIDREQVLKLANTAKLQEQWREQQKEKRRQDEIQKQKDLHEFWTYKRVYNLMRCNSENVFGRPWEDIPHQMDAIKAICFFVSRNDRFMTELKYDAQKGLLLRGPSGTGKTHLVRCVENNGLNPILTQSMLDVDECLRSNGEFKFMLNGQKIIYLEDVGTEEPVINFYGTKICWFKNFIEGLYLKTKCFNHLIISTNLSFKNFEEQYGYRVASRMREMFNVIDLKGNDLRDKKNLTP